MKLTRTSTSSRSQPRSSNDSRSGHTRSVLEEDLSTGDIVLYSGSHPLHVRQREVTGCRWSQVAMILRLPEIPFALVFESTKLSPCPDVCTGSLINGVQIGPFAKRVELFEGQVAVRELEAPPAFAAQYILQSFAANVHGLPFNDSRYAAGRAFLRRNSASDETSFFCSELIATAFQRAGILPLPPAGLTPNNFIPADFSSEYRGAHLPLAKGCWLGKETRIK